MILQEVNGCVCACTKTQLAGCDSMGPQLNVGHEWRFPLVITSACRPRGRAPQSRNRSLPHVHQEIALPCIHIMMCCTAPARFATSRFRKHPFLSQQHAWHTLLTSSAAAPHAGHFRWHQLCNAWHPALVAVGQARRMHASWLQMSASPSVQQVCITCTCCGHLHHWPSGLAGVTCTVCPLRSGIPC
jgi:hypothetical protein